MSDLNQVLLGALAALFSSVIIIGAMILAFTEGGQSLSMAFTPTSSPSPLPPVDTPKPGEPTFTPSPTSLPSATPEPIIVNTCPMPEGWLQIEVLPGDTLDSIAVIYDTSQARLQVANCLQTSNLIVGTILFVPTLPPTPTTSATATSTPTPTETPKPTATRRVKKTTCGRPSGWKSYIVQRKDTLYSISRAYYTTVAALKSANCLTSNVIRVGQRLYVPNVSPRPPAATKTAAPKPDTPTATLRPSDTPVDPSPTPQDAATPVPPTAQPTVIIPPTDTLPPLHTDTLPPPPTDPPPPPTDPPAPTQEINSQPTPTTVPE
jgi:LysM repeat protein